MLEVSMSGYRELAELDLSVLRRLTDQFVAYSQQPESCLAWLPSGLHQGSEWQNGTKALVVDMGGSFLRVAVAMVIDSELKWLEQSTDQPMKNHHPDPDSLVSWLGRQLLPWIKRHQIQQLAFILSYPHSIKVHYPYITAVLNRQTKSLTVPGLEGFDIGEALLRWLEDEGVALSKLVVMNDSIATALAAEGEIGLVVGTGGNVAAIHPHHPDLRNTEAGNFDAIAHTQASALIDIMSQPGEQTMEKQTTGQYLYQLLLNQLILQAWPLELVSHLAVVNQALGSAWVSQVAAGTFQDAKLDPDKQAELQHWAEVLITNSYQLWATAVAGCMKLNAAHQQFTIGVTGAVALNCHQFLPGLQQTITQLTDQQFRLKLIKHPMEGAAKAVLRTQSLVID